MRRITPSVCAHLFALGAYAPAKAGKPEACRGADLTHVDGIVGAEARRADDLLNADGLLWQINKPGLAPSYLYGAIHSTDDSALELARRAAQHIHGSKVVATEIGGPIDTIQKADIAAKMLARALDHDHDTFDGLVTVVDRERVESLLKTQGYPVEFAHHLKLWFLAILTAIPACEAKRQALDLPEVDQFLAETAKTSGVKVIGLETAQEQLDALSAMRPDAAAALLAVAARDPSMNDDVYATMLQLYRESRPAEILPITDVAGKMSEAERAAEDEFTQLLLVGRNANMAERASPLLKKGGAFIAVGALHLSGKGGLVERLRAAGYKVTKVW